MFIVHTMNKNKCEGGKSSMDSWNLKTWQQLQKKWPSPAFILFACCMERSLPSTWTLYGLTVSKGRLLERVISHQYWAACHQQWHLSRRTAKEQITMLHYGKLQVNQHHLGSSQLWLWDEAVHSVSIVWFGQPVASSTWRSESCMMQL